MAARSRIPTFAGRKNPLGTGAQISTQENASSKKRAPAPSVQSPNPKARKILRTTNTTTPAQKRAHPSPPPPSTSRKRPKTSEDVDPMDCIVPPEPSRARSTTGFDIPLTTDKSLLGEPGPDISSGGLYSDFEEQETWMLKSMAIHSPAPESPPRRKTRQSTVTPRPKVTPRQRSTTPRRRQSTPRRYEPKTLPPPIVTPTAAQARKEARLAALQAEAEAKLRASVESDGLGELSVVGEEDEEDEDTVRPEDDEDTVGDERTVRQDEEDPLAWDTPPRSQASNASTPRAGASTTPRTLASTTPRTLPSTTPRTLPSTTPKTLPSTTPRTRPSTTPKTLPSATPRTLSSTTPRTLPSTTPRTRPTTTPATASSSRTKSATVHFPSSDHDESGSESEYDPPTDVSEPVAEEGEVSRSTRSRPSIGTELARLSITEGEQEGPDVGQPGSDEEQGTDGEQGDTDEEGNISTRTRSRASLTGALKRMESLQLHEEQDEDEEPPVRSPFKRGRGRGATRGRGRASSQRSDVFGSPQREEEDEEEHGGNVSVRGRGRGSGSRRRSSSRGGRSPSRGGHSPTRGARGGRGGRGRGRASPTRSSPRKPTTTPIKSPMRVEVVVPVRRRRSSGESRLESSQDVSRRTDGNISQRTDGDDSQDSDEDVTRHTDGNDSRYTDGDLSQRTDGDVTRGTEGDSLPSDEDHSDEDVSQEADVTQRTTGDVSRRTSGDASSRTGMDISRRTSGDVSQRSSMDVSRRTSGSVSARTGMDISRRTSGDISRLSSMDVSRRTSADVSRRTSADVSQRPSMDISRRTSATNQSAIFQPDDTIIAPAPSSSAPSGSNASYAPTNASFSSAKPSSASAVGSVTLQQPTPDYSSLDQSPGGRQEDMEDTGTEVPETSLPGTPADDEYTQLNDTRDLSAEHTRKSIGVPAHQTLSNLLREQQRRTSMNSSLAGATPGMKRSTFKKTPARSGGLKILPESHPTPGTSLSLSQLRPTTGQASRSYAVESIQASTSYTLKTSSIQPPTSNTFQPRISQASQSFRPSQSTQPFRPTQSIHTPHPTQATRSFRLRTINDSVDIDIELSPDQSRSMRSEFEFNAQSTPFVRGARPSLGLGAFERLGIGEMTVDEDEDPDVDVEGSDRDEEEQREGSQVDEEENRRQEEQAEEPLGQEDDADAQSDAHSSEVIDETPEPGTREISVVLDTSSPHRSLRTERVPTPRAGRISQVEESDSDEGPPLPPSPSAGRSSFHEGDSGSITGRRLSDILKIRAQQVRDRSGRSADTSGDLTASGELTRLSDQAQDVLDTSNTSGRRLNLAGSSSGRVWDAANSSKALERSTQKGNRSDVGMTSRASTSRVQQASERETTQDYDASVRFDGRSHSAIQRSGTPVFRSGQTPSQHEDEDDQSMAHLDDSGEGQRSSGASVHSSGRSQEGDLTGADGEVYERSEDEELDYDENGEPIIKISGPPEAVVRAKSALLQAGYTEDEEILEQYSRSRSERSRSRSVSRARSTSRAAESSVRHVSVASTSYGHFVGDRTSGLSRSQMMAEASRYEDWEPPSRRQLRTRKWTEHDWRMLAHYMRRVQKSQALTSGLSSRQELDLRMVDIPAVVERFIEEEGHGIKLEGEWDPAEIVGRTEFLIQTEGYKKDGSWRTTLMSMTAHGFPGSSTQRHEDEEAEEESPPRNRMLPAALAEQPGRKRAAVEPKRDVWSVFGEPSPAPSNEEPEAPVEEEEAEEQPVEEEQEEQEQDPTEEATEEMTYEDEPYPDEPRGEESREESYEQPDEPEAEEPLDDGASNEEQYESIGGTRLPLSVTVSPERARQARQPRPHVDVSVPTNRRLDTSLRSQQGGPSTPMARFIGSISSFITGRSQNGQANTSGPQLKPVSRNPIDLTHVEDEDEPRFPVLNHVPTPVRPTPARNRRQKRVEPRIDARPLQHVSPPRPVEPARPRPPIRRVGSVKELAKSFEIMEENSRKEAELARTVGAQSRRVVSESSRPNRAVPVFMPTQKAPLSAPAPQPPIPAPVKARPRAAARTRRAGIPSPTKKRPKVEPVVITISDSED